MSGKAKKIWMITPGSSDTPRRMYEKKGGKYTRKEDLLNQVQVLIRCGYKPKVFESELNWTELPVDDSGMPVLD
jgi:hypothetical protein